MNTTTIDKYGGTTAFIAQPRCEECLEAECYYASDPSSSATTRLILHEVPSLSLSTPKRKWIAGYK
jgi:hypothetical protein